MTGGQPTVTLVYGQVNKQYPWVQPSKVHDCTLSVIDPILALYSFILFQKRGCFYNAQHFKVQNLHHFKHDLNIFISLF